jgi:hypothetical protein
MSSAAQYHDVGSGSDGSPSNWVCDSLVKKCTYMLGFSLSKKAVDDVDRI